jgi:alpha-L-fucosidase 2
LARAVWSSLYLLRLACMKRDAPPGLYGPFVTADRMGWGGDLHLNYNLQAVYYGCERACRVAIGFVSDGAHNRSI